MQSLIMKAPLFSLCFILFSIYTSCAAAEEVVDIDGKEVQTGVDYYMLPVIRGSGGGVTQAKTGSGNTTCPLGVIQEPLEVRNGLPLTFHPVSSEGVVRVSTDLNIKFSAASTCVQSTVWRLGFEESIQRYMVTTGGVEGNPGSETISNWFKIERYERDYKLVYCPGVCNICRPVCGNIGIFVQDKQRRLTLSLVRDEAVFRVMFKKASK